MKRARGASEVEHPEEPSAETTVERDDDGGRDVFVVVEVDSDVKLESLKPSDFDLQVSFRMRKKDIASLLTTCVLLLPFTEPEDIKAGSQTGGCFL